jgi:hypothetical protein
MNGQNEICTLLGYNTALSGNPRRVQISSASRQKPEVTDRNTMATKAKNRDARSVEIRQWWSVTLDMDGLRRLLMDARTLEALQHQR